MDYVLRDLLKIDALKGATFIGNHSDLDLKVTGATVIDSPDISSWIKGGELILTSFYPIKGLSSDEMKAWMNGLADKRISALIVKIPKVFDEIPESVLSVSQDRSIPIIKIPKDIAFIDITYPVMETLFNQQVKKLKYFKEIHSRFTSLSLKNVGSEGIIKTLEELIGNPVTVYSDSFQKIASTNEDVDLFYEMNGLDEDDSYYDTKFPFYRRTVVFPKLQERECEQILVPIKTINNKQVNLVVSAINKTVTEYDFIAMENAATSLSLDLAKQIAVSEVEKKFKNDFIDDLISGKIKTMDTLYDRASITHIDTEGKYAVVIFNLKSIKVRADETEIEEGHEQLHKLLNSLSDTISFYLSDAIIRSRTDQIIVLWKVNVKAGDEKYEINKMKQTVENIRVKFKANVVDYSLQVGIGEISPTIMNLSQSYREAQDTLNIGQSYYPDDSDFTISFNDLGIYRLLYQFDDVNKLKAFIPGSLEKLLAYKHSNKDALIKTLNVFLQCHQNIAKSAQLLYVHYKTVTYRLDRIKEITGMNFEDSEEMLSVQVGLRIIDIIHDKD